MAHAVRLLEAMPRAAVYLRPLLLAVIASAAASCRPMILAVDSVEVEVEVAPPLTLSLTEQTAIAASSEPVFDVALAVGSEASTFPSAGTVSLWRDADANCSGGVMLDQAEVAQGASSASLKAHYVGFTALEHTYRVGFVPASGQSLCSSELRGASTGIAGGFTSLKGAYYHMCAIRSDKTVACWGAPAGAGTLGSGSIDVKHGAPNPVAGLVDVAQIETGFAHTCARTTAGAVWCWGQGTSGQLGNGASVNALTPVNTGLAGVVSIALGNYTSCALMPTGGVKCWGMGTNGRLGNGGVGNSNIPVDVTGVSDAVAIAAGGSHACALIDDGAANIGVVKCWGKNNLNQMADGTVVDATTAVAIPGISGAQRLHALGSYPGDLPLTCVQDATNAVTCWGSATFATPTALAMAPPQAFQVGINTIYATYADGAVQAAVPAATPALSPLGISGVTALAPGNLNASCALTAAGGYIRCWGKDATAFFGRGDRGAEGRPIPRKIDVDDVQQLVLREEVGCVILGDATIRCWGSNSSGQLGNGTTTSSPVPINPGLTGVRSVSIGYNHTCAAMLDKTLRCWGDNSNGQLGDGTTTASLVPINPGMTDVENVSAGSNYTCVALTSGVGQCWGRNSNGQLGNATLVDSLAPVTFIAPTPIASFAVDANNGCALLTNGSTRCAGWGSGGWLGNGAGGNYSTPIQIIANNVVEISDRGNRHCARHSSGQVTCSGTIGSAGNVGWQFHMQYIAGGGVGTSSIATGSGHTCALRGNGDIQCWGGSPYGSMGDGVVVNLHGLSNTNFWLFEPVVAAATAQPHLQNVVKLAAGRNQTCAIQSDGVAKCWGYLGSGLGTRVGYLDYSTIANATYVMEP